MTSVDPSLPRDKLEAAFQAFNQVSEQLSSSYAQLQEQVRHLNQQLAAARSERMQQLAETEQLAHRLAQLLDALPAAVVVLDAGQRVQQYNPVAISMLPGIDVGIHWPSLYRELFQPNHSGTELELPSGRLVNLTECVLSPESGRILLLLDITETRRLQARIEHQQRLSAMGEMAAQLAHQIRTPLASALLYNNHLARDDLSPEQRRRFSDRSLARLRHIESQINDMLSFSRGGDYLAEALNLVQLLQELVHTLETLAAEKHISIHLSGLESSRSARIMGNYGALLGAMMNIAGNALEHSPDGGRIEIELREGVEDWQVLIRDQGPGVPEGVGKQIFKPFFTTRSDGTGLGLAVAQTVVLGHRGRIDLCDQPFNGACFSMILPKLESRDRPTEIPLPLPESGERDNEMMRSTA